MTVQSYRDLIAWEKSFDLAAEVVCVTKCFPREEIYGLTSQVRRAAMLIPSNIAEGQGRMSSTKFWGSQRSLGWRYSARSYLCYPPT